MPPNLYEWYFVVIVRSLFTINNNKKINKNVQMLFYLLLKVLHTPQRDNFFRMKMGLKIKLLELYFRFRNFSIRINSSRKKNGLNENSSFNNEAKRRKTWATEQSTAILLSLPHNIFFSCKSHYIFSLQYRNKLCKIKGTFFLPNNVCIRLYLIGIAILSCKWFYFLRLYLRYAWIRS